MSKGNVDMLKYKGCNDIPVYHDMFGPGSITGTAMQKTGFVRYGFKIQIHLKCKVLSNYLRSK
jgi:hypothetical protein